ncbi:unnamed protein product [Mytilus coruscus]|uniref:VWFA domain-containing protein n=1 Tax=Mytilus coruscus TaxID=42192 RepID=A0A6J8BTH3_MYTCO|nr:unnamed protein product [Mytilus coruscus]
MWKGSRYCVCSLSKIRRMRGGTRTDYALHDMRSKVLTEAHGDRPDYPNIGIVITDGKSNYPKKTKEQMVHMKEDGVMIFAIGIGSAINQKELETIALEKDHALRVKGFDSLEHIIGEFQEITCRGIYHNYMLFRMKFNMCNVTSMNLNTAIVVYPPHRLHSVSRVRLTPV